MRFVMVVTVLLASGCPHGARPNPQPDLTAAQVVDRLAKARAELAAFRADTTMDYWLNNQRAKVEVLVMGKISKKVRFLAESPAGGAPMAEMACDGTNFVYVDHQKNCVMSGPCDRRSIAQFFRISLEPDDFIHLALGAPPVAANATGKVTWDGDNGLERVELAGADGTEKLAIDTRDGHFDVVQSELVGSDGKLLWSVANTDFGDVGGHRIPGKTRFKSPANSEDLLVDWGEASARAVNPELGDDKFVLPVPDGLPHC